MPIDPDSDFGNWEFGYGGNPYDPRTSLTTEDPLTDFGHMGNSYAVYAPTDVGGGDPGRGGVVVFMLNL
jgi:hypothetical protein